MEQLGITAQDKLGMLLVCLSNPTTQMLMAPLLACLLIALTPPKRTGLIKLFAVLGAGLSFLATILMATGLPQKLTAWPAFAQYLAFEPSTPGFQFEQRYRWMSVQLGEFQSFGVDYFVGVDGLSMPLLLMGAGVIFLAVLWGLQRTERVRDYFALMMLMTTGILGSFVALDYVLFYLFWELMLIPMYFLITGWGQNREAAGRAGIKFFIFTLFGSVFMLIAFIAIQIFASGVNVYTYSIPETSAFMRLQGMAMDPLYRQLMFIGLLLAFAVKAPMFPFHTWLPDAHSEAPTEMSVILAAVMLKTGSYAYLRILYPTFPDIAYSYGPVIAFCGVVAIVYGGAITLVQTDLKRMVAYSSISHMGFIILGISAMNYEATSGAIFHMVGHGVIIATLFFLTGVIEKVYGTLDMRKLAGLFAGARPYAMVLGVAAFAGMGLPGLIGFWGELLIIKGTFFNNPMWTGVHVGAWNGSQFLQIMAVASVLGVLISAVYMINMLQRIMPGDLPSGIKPLTKLSWIHALALIPLVLAIVILGLNPGPVLSMCKGWAEIMFAVSMGIVG